MTTAENTEVVRISTESLQALEEISAVANAKLAEERQGGQVALASLNAFTDGAALNQLSSTSSAVRRSLEAAAAEPAIARVVVRTDDDNEVTYYITRDTPPGRSANSGRLAARNSPFGRIASLSVGDSFEITTPKAHIEGVVIERALLRPTSTREEWDSVESILSGDGFGPITVVSMRQALVEAATIEAIDSDALSKMVAEASLAELVVHGRRRDVIAKMALRDQPILDRYQDDIFRLPLSSRLMIVGPPGTGKTTTLIRRLGQKIDLQYLEQDERALVDRAASIIPRDHSSNWIMFTPTNLLKLYLRDAFNNEKIVAPSANLWTWNRYRTELARNKFRILRSGNNSGPFISRETDIALNPEITFNQTEWFKDFSDWQSADVVADLKASVEELIKSNDGELTALGKVIVDRLNGEETAAEAILALIDLQDRVAELLQNRKSATDAPMERHLTLMVNRDKLFIKELADFLSTLSVTEDSDDQDTDDEDEAPASPPKTPVLMAINSYYASMRTLARNRLQKKASGKETRAGRILAWIGDRRLPDDVLVEVGEGLRHQAALRRFSNLIRRYVNGIPARYRRFRRLRQIEGIWYLSEGFTQTDLGPQEQDVILLCSLGEMAKFAANRSITRDIDRPAFSPVRDFLELTRNQVVVDEATDFSPLQLACMLALSNPTIGSFAACGDFNQRITSWGSRDEADVIWAVPRVDIRPINTSYRHSRQLAELATRLIEVAGVGTDHATLPDGVANDGVSPVLGRGHDTPEQEIAWIGDRIVEVEKLTDTLPSVAVLVPNESEVVPTAEALRRYLAPYTINVVPCTDGQVVGEEGDVRVFDVQHIKGLEFEAVFFQRIDDLLDSAPDLFDKYLYVGATRAATYLGITCRRMHLPGKLEGLRDIFTEAWET